MRTSATTALFITKPRNFVRKPQKWRSLRKESYHKYVPRSGTTLFDVFDADILCGIPSPQVSLRYTSG